MTASDDAGKDSAVPSETANGGTAADRTVADPAAADPAADRTAADPAAADPAAADSAAADPAADRTAADPAAADPAAADSAAADPAAADSAAADPIYADATASTYADATAADPAAADPAAADPAAATYDAAWQRPFLTRPDANANANGADGPALVDAPEAAETPPDPADVPFWDWAPSEESTERHESGNGFPQDEAGDEGAASARHRRSPDAVVTPVLAAREQPQHEGIGQHVGNLAHLSANPRLRAWQRRTIIAIIVGVVFTIIARSWRVGLTLAVLAAIADTIYRSRRAFIGHGKAQLTAAQRRTRRQLSRLERAGYRAMDCVHIPGGEDQIDHLVFGPAGVFAIDSEAWDKRLPVRTRIGRELWHGPHSMKERLEHARWKSERAAELMSGALGSRVTIRPAMAIYGPKILWDVTTIRDVDVFSGPRLRKYLRRRSKQGGRHSLSGVEIERLDKAAHTALPREAAADPPSR